MAYRDSSTHREKIITASFPTTPFDWYNYTAQDYNSNALIQFILRFDGEINFDLLQRAFSCCMKAEPILGCTFDTKNDVPLWKAINPNLSSTCQHRKTADVEKAINSFLAERIDAGKECPVKVALLTNSEETVLVAKLHHALCDVGGALQFVKLLADMYSKVTTDAEFAAERIAPNRGTKDLYDYFDVTDKEKRFDPSLLSAMISTWGTPIGDNSAEQTFAYQTVQFEPSAIERIKQFAKTCNSSLNAVVTMAYHSALTDILQPAEAVKEMQFTANLRRYTKNARKSTICNLSNTFNVQLPTRGTFEELAQVATSAIDKVIEPEMILQGVLACELMSTDFKTLSEFYAADWDSIKKSGLCTPMISNVGLLDAEPINFGNMQPADMYVITPAFVGPSFMLSVSTYHNIITLNSAYYKPSTSDEFVASLLNKIQNILQKI